MLQGLLYLILCDSTYYLVQIFLVIYQNVSMLIGIDCCYFVLNRNVAIYTELILSIISLLVIFVAVTKCLDQKQFV